MRSSGFGISRGFSTAAAMLPLFAAMDVSCKTTAMQEQTSPTSGKPNVLVIVADDLGFGELSAQGNPQIPTPNIDSIAKNGVRFTNGYVTCPVCSPTRAGLLTGRYQERFGHEMNPGGSEGADFGLPLNEKTLADALKAEGYVTGIFGKWHLGNTPERHPKSRGFDEFYGFLGGAHSYIDWGKGRSAIMRGNEPANEPGAYATEVYGREAQAFIKNHAGKPFFVYLPFNAVHSPLQAPEKYLQRFAHIQDTKRRTFAAMLSAMDDAVGGVLQALRDAKQEENTIVFFISDNGGPTPSTTSGNGPLRGYKGQVLEGGIRIPYMMQWKGRIPAAQTYEKPVISLDIFATAMAAAGNPKPKEIDGVNLLPFVTGKDNKDPHKSLFWRFGQQAAIRSGDWKLVIQDGQTSQLYSLAKDIGETMDLALARPEKAQQLANLYKAWDSELVPPLWVPAGKKGDKFSNLTKELAPTSGTAAAKPEKPAKAGKADKAGRKAKTDKPAKADRADKKAQKAAKRAGKQATESSTSTTE